MEQKLEEFLKLALSTPIPVRLETIVGQQFTFGYRDDDSSEGVVYGRIEGVDSYLSFSGVRYLELTVSPKTLCSDLLIVLMYRSDNPGWAAIVRRSRLGEVGPFRINGQLTLESI